MLLVSISPSRGNESAASGPSGEPYTGGGAFPQDLPPEMEQFSRAAPGRRRELAGALDQALILDQTAEILLVELDAGNGLHGSLQIKQREASRHQFEYDRAVLHLAAQA